MVLVEMIEAVVQIFEQILHLARGELHGLPGIHTGDGATAASWVRRGFRWVTVVSEYGLVINGATRELEACRAAIAAP